MNTPEPLAAPATAPTDPAPGLGGEDAPLRVLLVDDDPDHAALAARRLARSSLARFEVEHAASAAEARARRAGAAWPDALVLDYRLAETDGLTLLGELRAAGTTAPALLLTGQGSEAVAAAALEARADFYLSKQEGLTGDALARAVVGMVDRHRLAASLDRAAAEAARLEGIRLTAVHLADVINNRLAELVGFIELLRLSHALPSELVAMAEMARAAARAISDAIGELHGVTRVETRPTPVGAALDPARSGPGVGPAGRRHSAAERTDGGHPLPVPIPSSR
jgi:CheY-like chemotaxis protein